MVCNGFFVHTAKPLALSVDKKLLAIAQIMSFLKEKVA